jgi:predicted ArsR family transcriptional regulator
MKSTREKIMRRLLDFPGSTINDLALAVGINGISIRHHLTAMEAENLVYSAEERHGVGRPRLTYTLTNKGFEQFPTNYIRFTNRLLKILKDRMTADEIIQLFGEIGTSIAYAYKDELIGKSLDNRIQTLKSVLKKEGFITEVYKNKDKYILTTLSCPYYQIGLDHPEICACESNIIQSILASPVENVTCIFKDADCCTYYIPIESNEVQE